MRIRAGTILVAALTAMVACSRPPAEGPRKMDAVPDSMLATIESVEAARQVAADETLRVRLRGVVGPDGSWAADTVLVRHDGQHIVIEPRVRRVPGEMFIQMVIPLDVVVAVPLAAGTWMLEARGRGGVQRIDNIEVGAGLERVPPVVELEAATAQVVDGGAMLPIRVRAKPSDGWIARIEVRGFGSDPQQWRDPGPALPEGSSLVADFGVLRPPGDAPRRIEARAVDGQGGTSAVATLELPAR